MRTVQARRKKRRSKKSAAPKRRRRRVHATAVAAPRRKRRRAKKASSVKRRRRRTVRVEARRRRRRVRAVAVAAPRRRRRRVKAWRGDSAGHATAARKGHRRRKHRRAAKKGHATRRARRGQSPRVYDTTVTARRRRRSRRSHESTVMESPRRRRYHRRAHASRGGAMGAMEFGVAIVTAGLGFVLADGLDRFLATYNPSSTDPKPTDRYTSDGAGTLANTLNVSATPNWKRLAAGAGATAVPAIGSMYVRNPMLKSATEGLAIGAGVSFFKTLWNNVLMPMLIGKDTTTPALQKSYIARLYPAETAAHISRQASKGADGKLAPGPYSAAGVLSDKPATADVGPFALGGDSPYPDAARALRHEAGMGGDSPYPDAHTAIRHAAGMGGDSPYPDAHTAIRHAAGVGYEPGPPPGVGPGPQAEPHVDCGCVGDPTARFTAFLGDQATEE